MENKTLWVKIDERKPETDGKYVVIWANPYSNDEMVIDVAYFMNGHFSQEKAGANYIAFWLENLEAPYLSKEERNKLVVTH